MKIGHLQLHQGRCNSNDYLRGFETALMVSGCSEFDSESDALFKFSIMLLVEILDVLMMTEGEGG